MFGSIARVLVQLVVAVGISTLGPSAWAACGDSANDAADVAAARTVVDAHCSCDLLPTHRLYVECARAIARKRFRAGLLREECKSDVKSCAMNSICGRDDGAVLCCTTRKGKSRCRVVADPTRCIAPQKGTACISSASSACDASSNGDCTPLPTPAPTSTPVACGNPGFPTCGGTCPDGRICQAFLLTGSGSLATCVCSSPDTPCGFGQCGSSNDGVPGFCPPGQVCYAFVQGGGAECNCGNPPN